MAGASGYVLKEVRGADLIDSVRRVAAGQSLLDPVVTARVLERLRNPPRDALTASLSPQESAILGHLADGLTNRRSPSEMFLAEKTVKNYVSNLLAKLGMNHRTQAAVYAARLAERRAHQPGTLTPLASRAQRHIGQWSASSDRAGWPFRTVVVRDLTTGGNTMSTATIEQPRPIERSTADRRRHRRAGRRR